MDQTNTIEIKNNQDIVVSSFSLQKNGAVAIGNPTFEQWSSCLGFVQKSEQAVHFWLGDIINWGSQTFGEKYTQAVEVTGFDIGTLQNDCYISKAVPIDNRKSELSFEHHKIVAKLEPDEQKKWLEKAADENLTVKELRRELSGRTVKEEDKQQSAIDLEVAAKNFCDKNSISREDMAIIVAMEKGEMVLINGHLKPVEGETKTGLQFLFGK